MAPISLQESTERVLVIALCVQPIIIVRKVKVDLIRILAKLEHSVRREVGRLIFVKQGSGVNRQQKRLKELQ